MYKRNERLRGGNETIFYTQEQLDELAKCAEDFEYWAEKYAKIVTLKDGVRLITFRSYQKRMMKTITSLKRKNKRGMVVLAPRQCGKTTAIYLYLLWYMIFHPQKSIAVIANKASNAEKILASMQKTYELLPLWMQPGLTDRGWNARSMEFANGSKLITGSATSDSIRGGSFNCITGDSIVDIENIGEIAINDLYSDERIFTKINNESISKEQILSDLPVIDLRGHEERGADRITPQNSEVHGWSGSEIELCHSNGERTRISSSSFGEVLSSEIQEDASVRIDSNVEGSSREDDSNECGRTRDIYKGIIDSPTTTQDGEKTFGRDQEAYREIKQGENSKFGNEEENIDFKTGSIEEYSEIERSCSKDKQCIEGEKENQRAHGEDQQKPRKNKEDCRKTPWDETIRRDEEKDFCNSQREDSLEQGIEEIRLFKKGEELKVKTERGYRKFYGIKKTKNQKIFKLSLSNGHSVKCTADHKIKTSDGWVEATKINIGSLIEIDGGLSELTKIDFVGYDDVYDLLEVEETHSFYANGILVHNCVYLDEYAFLPRHVADDFMKSVLPTILSDEDARIFTTSTPKGLNQFHTMWKKANKGDSLYEPCRVRWEEVPNYRKKGFKELIINTEGHITWKQEFECSFIGSSKTLISSNVLEEPTNIDPIRAELDGMFEMWKEPERGKTYILGVDTSKGVGGDYSVVQVCRIDSLRKIEQVAMFRSNMTSPNDFAQIIISISQYYNKAEIMLENNDYGHIVAEKIWNVYNYDLIVNFEKEILGVRSNSRSKALANTTLREYVDNGYLTTNSDTTWGEYSTYEEVKNDKFEAISGEHDDTVTAMLWVMYYLKASDDYSGETETIINPRFKIYASGEGIKSPNVTSNFNPTKTNGEMDFLDDDFDEFAPKGGEYVSESMVGDGDAEGDWLDEF